VRHSEGVASNDHPSADDITAALQSGQIIESTPEGVRIRAPLPSPGPGDETIAGPAVDDSGDPWLYVEVPEIGFEFDLEVGFSDPFVADHDDEIERSVEFLMTLPGVRAAVRQDPEQIFVLGTRDARRIRDALIVFFKRT
jgi:hypothetical protein